MLVAAAASVEIKISVTLFDESKTEFSFPDKYTVDQVKTLLFKSTPTLRPYKPSDFMFGFDEGDCILVEFLQFKVSHPRIMKFVSQRSFEPNSTLPPIPLRCIPKKTDGKKHISQMPTPDQTKTLLENINNQKTNHKSSIPSKNENPIRTNDRTCLDNNNTLTPQDVHSVALSRNSQLRAVLTIQHAYRRWAAKKLLKSLVEESKKSPESKRRCLRNQALKELVVTERDYISNLRTMLKLFYFPLSNRSQAARPILSEQDLKFIFANIEDIVQLSDSLYKKLYNQMRSISTKIPKKTDLVADTTSVGDIFLQMIPMMEVYSVYMRNYDASIQKFVSLLNSRPELRAYLEEVYSDEECIHKNLQFYLIMPVQRLPRYKMLLENLSNYTSAEHPDYNKIVSSIKKVDNVIYEINQRKRKEEELLAVQSSLIWGNDIEEIDLLDNPDRDLIYDGQLFTDPTGTNSSAKILDLLKDKNGRQVLIDTKKKIGIKNFVRENFNTLEKRVKAVKSSSYHCFLFNDLFIRTIEKKGFKYKALNTINFTEVIISSNPDPMQNVFQVKLNSTGVQQREITYLFYTQTTDDKEEWIKAFQKIPNAKYLEDNIYSGADQLYSKAIDTVKIGTLHLNIVEGRSLPKRDSNHTGRLFLQKTHKTKNVMDFS
eukprot:TRINITY_DN1972_c0_g1_i3.p1 TRINITY_DN1972_c0_g1~~TRINITY_DN1972_c0_g1_i3.p1  ORF type:complete len:657 (-),score=149.64 TRINITY_DN1972_c0_g1_i3:494-2464(-)